MIEKLMSKIFRANPTPDTAMAIMRAQTESLFVPSMISAGVRRIDPPVASLQEIEDAVAECRFYWANAYPETENDLVEWIETACYVEIERRLKGTIRDTMLKRMDSL